MSTAATVAETSTAGTLGSAAMDFAWQSYAEGATFTEEISPDEFANCASKPNKLV